MLVCEDKIDGGISSTNTRRKRGKCVCARKEDSEREERERERDKGEREIVEEMEMRVCERESEREREFSRLDVFTFLSKRKSLGVFVPKPCSPSDPSQRRQRMLEIIHAARSAGRHSVKKTAVRRGERVKRKERGGEVVEE